MAILRWQGAHAGWSFWLRWMAGTIAGLVIVLLLTVPLNAAAESFSGGPSGDSPGLPGFFYLGWALIGAGFGLGQWWALRGELKRSGWWVVATLSGYPLGSLIPTLLPAMDSPLVGGVVAMGSFGLALGFLQWLVLRGQVRQAGWWILISLAGWLLAVLVVGVASLSGTYVEPIDMLAAFLCPTALGGAGMAWLLAHRA